MEILNLKLVVRIVTTGLKVLQVHSAGTRL